MRTLTTELLQGVGLTDYFSLAHPDVYESALAGLGFPVKDQVIGKNEIVFDITSFTSLLGLYGPANHNFIITAVDAKGNTTVKALKLRSI